MALSIHVSLLSGRSVRLRATPTATVQDLRQAAQKKLRTGIASLVNSEGELLGPEKCVGEVGLREGARITATVQQARIVSCRRSPGFFLVRGDGSVLAWGDVCSGSPGLPRELRGVRQVAACSGGLAALLSNGQVLSWGSSCPKEVGQLTDIHEIHATEEAFAALLGDGSVICWGSERLGGNSAEVKEQLFDIKLLAASLGAFVAIREDGRIISWGQPCYGARSVDEPYELHGVLQLVATRGAFAALLDTGGVVSWGKGVRNAESRAAMCQLQEYG
ncbi:hypothetical protein AK812_SmicGene38317 [Symbiodinium microadriaticum]|uniref:Ubiquitin-like domain-containing protein n=1 Tax=Symbiodinium microadriaticum TaxID=2951 RepID=A0A1Q9CE30_SYMMI|nr:hypothetical protein AK812_SmicGene38317 [Symbiodinium microadriaticum]